MSPEDDWSMFLGGRRQVYLETSGGHSEGQFAWCDAYYDDWGMPISRQDLIRLRDLINQHLDRMEADA